MKKALKAVCFLPFLLLASVLFIFFVKSGNTPLPKKNSTPPESVSGEITASEIPKYRLIAENSYLNLYENSSIKHSEPLSSLSLPESDIKKLSKGLTFDSLNEAFAEMESYIN